MLSEKPININTFSLKSIDEKKESSTLEEKIQTSDESNPLTALESAFKQIPQELIGTPNGISDLLVNMNTLLAESPFKNMLQNVDQVFKKNKQEKIRSNWKLIELDEEHVIYLELANVSKDNLTVEISDNIVTIKIKSPIEDVEKVEENMTHTITLPYKIDVTNVKAYYHPSLIDIHIPKKSVHVLELLDRTTSEQNK